MRGSRLLSTSQTTTIEVSRSGALQRFSDDWPSLALLGVMLALVTTSVVIADWTAGLRSIVAVAMVSLLAGYLLANSSFSPLTALVASSGYGAFMIGLQQSLALSNGQPLRMRSLELLQRLTVWTADAFDRNFSDDEFVFVIFLSIITWFAAYNASWNIFRVGRLWRAVLPVGLGLVINISYYNGSARLDLYLLVYMLAVLLLAVHTNALARRAIWRKLRVGFVTGPRVNFLLPGVVASIILLAMAWLVPPAPANEQLASVWGEKVAPRLDLQNTWSNLFSSLSSGGKTIESVDYYGSQSLTLSGPINLADVPVLDVYVPRGPRYYWRSKVFDTFDGVTWTASSDAELTSEFGVLYYEDLRYQQRRNIRQGFAILMPSTRIVYSAGQPASIGLPVSFEVLFIDRNQERGSLIEMRVENPLVAGDGYEAISSVSYADRASLSAASTDYPAWVQSNYLQIPDSSSQRTLDLAAQLTAPYNNPYDKAEAVEKWLRQNIAYDESIAGPPPQSDAVDWVLFEEQAGYCSYYASSMVVLLRSQGIPARVAAGFAQGDYNPLSGAYRVLESDAHTWVEVFFPGYGWIEFEPTASRPAIATRGIPVDDGGEAAGIFGEEFSAVQQPPPAAASPDALQAVEQPQGFVAALFGSGSALGRIPILILWGVGVLTFSVLIGGAFGWREARRRGLSGLSVVARIYGTLNMLGSWLGVPILPSYTPHERAIVLAKVTPEAAQPIQQITTLYVRERFGTGHSAETLAEDTTANEAWQVARPALVRRIAQRRLRLRRKD